MRFRRIALGAKFARVFKRGRHVHVSLQHPSDDDGVGGRYGLVEPARPDGRSIPPNANASGLERVPSFVRATCRPARTADLDRRISDRCSIDRGATGRWIVHLPSQ
jgi:hypothetical protein